MRCRLFAHIDALRNADLHLLKSRIVYVPLMLSLCATKHVHEVYTVGKMVTTTILAFIAKLSRQHFSETPSVNDTNCTTRAPSPQFNKVVSNNWIGVWRRSDSRP